MMTRSFWTCVGAFCTLALEVETAATQNIESDTNSVTQEQSIKAAVLYNLTRFSKWPESQFSSESAKFNICGNITEPMLLAVHQIEKKRIGGRAVDVIALQDDVKTRLECHVLYISEKRPSAELLERYAEMGILTIGSGKSFVHKGGGISLYRMNNKIGFSINHTVLKRARILPSSKILKLANEVL